MLKPVPSLARLNKFGSEIETTIRECDDCFQKQLAVSSTSIQTLRRYAQFLQDICNNPMKALRVTSQADDLEDASARDHKEASIAVTLFHPVCVNALVDFLICFFTFCSSESSELCPGCDQRRCEFAPI